MIKRKNQQMQRLFKDHSRSLSNKKIKKITLARMELATENLNPILYTDSAW
jgi:hypothetical protein